MEKGYMHLAAIIDLNSRHVVGWSVSNSMDPTWCKQTLETAIKEHGASKIIITDKGSQFNAAAHCNLP